MRRQFILLKESPELKKGAILIEACDNGDQDFECKDKESIKHYKLKKGDRYIAFDRVVVLKENDWFEEIVMIPVKKSAAKKAEKLIKNLTK